METLGFDYGQRHSVEMAVRAGVREQLAERFPQWAPRLGEDHVLSLDVLKQIGGSSLTDDVAFAMQADGLPNTFVPGRNLLFLTLAGALAYRRGLTVIVTGVCETDYRLPRLPRRHHEGPAAGAESGPGAPHAYRYAADVAGQGPDLATGP